ncbi:hypothetical protein OC844_005006 [Tilletia horrida]|nr:hypothetical protein OC844_005006 [Tilletia horrida]
MSPKQQHEKHQPGKGKAAGNRPSDHKTGPAGEPMTPVPSASLVVLCPIRKPTKNSSSGGGGGGGSQAAAGVLEYATLMLERSARVGSSFRSAVVYPGGQLDLADETPFRLKSTAGELLEMDIRNEAYMSALRLCAVRETFEETGLLLMPSSGTGAGPGAAPVEGGMPLSRAVGYAEAGMGKDEWLAIREQVHNDASHFVPFLHRVWAKLGGGGGGGAAVPIAAMTHHSNWVTPRSVVRPAKRFDAHFFLTCLDRPDVFGGASDGDGGGRGQTDMGIAVDGTEATSLRIGTPRVLLQAAFEDKHVLYPPQAYILADLAAHIERNEGRAALPELAPLVFGCGKQEEDAGAAGGIGRGVTKVEEEARGLGGRNYTWDRKDVDPASASKAKERGGGIHPQSAAWVSTDSPPFSPESGKVQADLQLLREGVTAIEPHPLLKHGMNVPANAPAPAPAPAPAADAVIGDADCDTDVFVFPLVLPGDYQASSAQRAAAGNSPVVGQPLNRLFVSPRAREDGGGLVVKGAQRVGVGALRDFEIGLTLRNQADDEDEDADADADGDGERRKARL